MVEFLSINGVEGSRTFVSFSTLWCETGDKARRLKGLNRRLQNLMDVYQRQLQVANASREGKLCCKSLQNQNDLYNCNIILFPLSHIKLPHLLQQSIGFSIDKAVEKTRSRHSHTQRFTDSYPSKRNQGAMLRCCEMLRPP